MGLCDSLRRIAINTQPLYLFVACIASNRLCLSTKFPGQPTVRALALALKIQPQQDLTPVLSSTPQLVADM